jgi:ribosomal protein L22
MADETPEEQTPEEQPKPRRRKRRKPASTETTPAAEVEATEADEIEPTPEDVEAEEEAADVVLEAEAEIDEDSEPEAEEPEPSAPARPRRRRRGDDGEPLPPVLVRAQAKYVRSSARKARLVCDHIRGKSVEEARAILAHAPRAVARDWSKLLESAVANAEHNHELVGEDLYIKAVKADEGPTIKRYRPRALGRATRIRKRTSHLTILLTSKE